MNDLVIVGAGGFARETAQAVAAAGEFKLLGHLDDNPALHGTEVDGVPVLGGCDLVHELPAAQAVICVGNPGDYAARPASPTGSTCPGSATPPSSIRRRRCRRPRGWGPARCCSRTAC